MRTMYMDCFAGASGDMIIGALLDCGLDFDFLKKELAKLGVEDYEVERRQVARSGISATKFDVSLKPHKHDHSHHDDEHEASVPQHHHAEHHQPLHTPHGHPHRSLSDIKQMIAASTLNEAVKQRAQNIFQRIGEAEAKIHNVSVEQIHFHEVGAVDSIIDIVGACIGLESLGIEKIIASPLHVGSGRFVCAHGTYPAPGPATTELLRGTPAAIYSSGIEGELLTPTGAGIIATLSSDFGPLPLMQVEQVGYGAGSRDYPKFPNVLRVMVGETAA